MAFKARTTRKRPNEDLSRGPNRTIGGVEFSGAIREYPGEPNEAMLADDFLDVQTLTGDPWPDSAWDRISKTPRSMAFAKVEGRWPTEHYKAIDANVERKLKDPEKAARFIMKQRGEKKEDIEKHVATHVRGHSALPDLSGLDDAPPEPKPERVTRPASSGGSGGSSKSGGSGSQASL